MNKKTKITIFTVALLGLGGIGFGTYKAIEQHPISYDLDGGTMVTKETAETVRWIDDVKAPEAKKDHYVFKGWSDGNEVMTSIKHARNDVNLTAVYNPEVYTLTFKDGDKEISKSNYAYGSETKLSDVFVKATLADHPYENFLGWQIDGKDVASLSSTDFGNKIVTTKFEGKSYRITYETYDGDVEGAPVEYIYGEGISEFPDASKAGKIFDGWFSDEDCTNQVTSIPADSHGEITLYASYHDAPVVQRNVSSRRSYSGGTGSYQSTDTGSSSGSMDLSIGCSIPEIGYHVDYAVVDGGQAAIDAPNSGMIGYWDLTKFTDPNGNVVSFDEGINHFWEEGWNDETIRITGWYDHASQGLSNLPYRLSTGSVCYLNGVAYTYSGYYSIGTWHENHYEYPLVVQTCTPQGGGVNFYCYFYRS